MFNPAPKPPPREKKPRQPLRSKTRLKTTTRLKSSHDPIPKKIREEVHNRDNDICQGCGNKGSHLHHIIFRSQGGQHALDNLVMLCRRCHELAHTYREYRLKWERWRDKKYGVIHIKQFGGN